MAKLHFFTESYILNLTHVQDALFQHTKAHGRYYLKFVSALFYQIFISLPNDSPSKPMKSFLFHMKSSFCSRDIQIFVIFSLSILPTFKRTNGSGIIYDVINWLA